MYGALCATNNQHGEVKGVKLIMWKQDSFSFHTISYYHLYHSHTALQILMTSVQSEVPLQLNENRRTAKVGKINLPLSCIYPILAQQAQTADLIF